MLICQLTDLHVCAVGRAVQPRFGNQHVRHTRVSRGRGDAPAPDVVIITGDLTESGMPAEYANLAALLRQYLPMPVYVIPGNHDRRDNFAARSAHLPGVTRDPDYVQYAVDDYPVRLVMLDTLVSGSGHGELARRATGLARSHAGGGAGQADDGRHASSAVRLRHRSHGPDRAAQYRGLQSGDRAASAGATDRLRPPSSADLRAGGAGDSLDRAVGRASGGTELRSGGQRRA